MIRSVNDIRLFIGKELINSLKHHKWPHLFPDALVFTLNKSDVHKILFANAIETIIGVSKISFYENIESIVLVYWSFKVNRRFYLWSSIAK